MAERRGVERRAVLAAAAAKMRCSMADLLTSFNGIQVTIATAAQALIASRLDCKTARRLLWDLQRMAKLLELYHRAKAQTTKDTHSTPLSQAQGRSGQAAEHEGSLHVALAKALEISATKNWAANERENARIIKPAVVVFPCDQWSNGPPRWAKAA
jgi:hypothetical protein